MLDIYAQEIVETLSETLERSVIVTDIDGVIIAAPAPERIGTVHPPSIPVMKYGKMSFDDNDAARRLGVWYPGATIPIFFQGKVVGSVAIAGEPEVVSKFALLVKKQVESILREKILIESRSSAQAYLNGLVKDIYCFDPARSDPRVLITKAGKINLRLDIPRVVVAMEFSSFGDLDPSKNKLRIPYSSKKDPFSEEMEYQSLQNNVINIIRDVFSNPQDIVSSTAKDRFVVMKAVVSSTETNYMETIHSQCTEVFGNLQKNSINTTIGIGSLANNLHDIHMSYDNATDTIAIAENLRISPGVFHFYDLPMEQLILSMRPQPRHGFIWDRVAHVQSYPGGQELIDTFIEYCHSLFSKLHTAEKLFIHRNTLIYRLNKLEKILDVDFSDFSQMVSFYIACRAKTILNKTTGNP